MQLASPEGYQTAIEKLFLIVDKHATTRPFLLNEPQKQILYNLTRRDIILKARQEGISSLILALFAVDFLFIENVRCVVISHEREATKKLFDRVKSYLESIAKTYPGELPYKLKYNSRSELTNTVKNSVFYIGTAGARAFGHGDTINNLHISELSRWPDQETMMIGLMQAVPRDGRIIVETTANGIGDYFYNLWTKSQGQNSSFKTHFLPWFLLEEYSLPIKGEFIASLEESELQTTYKLTNEQLNWRRWKMSELGGNEDAFNEQFPSNPEEAFIVSGNPIWSPTLLKKYLHRCKEPKAIGNLVGGYQIFFEENPKGYLKVWETPKVGHDYVIGADVAEGLEVLPEDPVKDNRRDYSAAYVMDRQTAEIVASWHGHIDGDQYGRQLEMLGRWYNEAFVGIEKNYQGLAPLVMMRDLNYPKIYYREKIGAIGEKMTGDMGWKTDRFTRPMMIDEGSKWLREERIQIYDKDLVKEMMSFVRYPDGQGRAASSAFDDRVISFLITIQMYLRNPITEKGNQIEAQEGSGWDIDSQGGNLMQGDDSFDWSL